jgi:hypothetical protein
MIGFFNDKKNGKWVIKYKSILLLEYRRHFFILKWNKTEIKNNKNVMVNRKEYILQSFNLLRIIFKNMGNKIKRS